MLLIPSGKKSRKHEMLGDRVEKREAGGKNLLPFHSQQEEIHASLGHAFCVGMHSILETCLIKKVAVGSQTLSRLRLFLYSSCFIHGVLTLM